MSGISVLWAAPTGAMGDYSIEDREPPQWYINVYRIPNDGARWIGQPVESKSLSDALGSHGNRLYRLRVKLKGAA